MDEKLKTFDHHSLDAYRVALEALTKADVIARGLPRGYGPMKDQLQRATQSAFLQTAEGAARRGGERAMRLRGAVAEASEAAAALEALDQLGIVSRQRVEEVVSLLGRLCAMLSRLARLAR